MKYKEGLAKLHKTRNSKRRNCSKTGGGDEYIEGFCVTCGDKCFIHKPSYRPKKGNYCSASCYPKGENSPFWKGGHIDPTTGYKYIGRSRKPIHRLVAEKALGRELKPREIVHHINGDKLDNRNCNLIICTQSYHIWLHYRMSYLYQQEHF